MPHHQHHDHGRRGRRSIVLNIYIRADYSKQIWQMASTITIGCCCHKVVTLRMLSQSTFTTRRHGTITVGNRNKKFAKKNQDQENS